MSPSGGMGGCVSEGRRTDVFGGLAMISNLRLKRPGFGANNGLAPW